MKDKVVLALGKFWQLASFESVYVSNGLGEFGQLADFWHSSVLCTWRGSALGEFLVHLRVIGTWRDFTLGESSTWHDISIRQGDISHLAIQPLGK